MEAGTTPVDTILDQIKRLSELDRIELLEKVSLLLKREGIPADKVKLSSLGGLGTEIWKDIDLDAYVEKERQWD